MHSWNPEKWSHLSWIWCETGGQPVFCLTVALVTCLTGIYDPDAELCTVFTRWRCCASWRLFYLQLTMSLMLRQHLYQWLWSIWWERRLPFFPLQLCSWFRSVAETCLWKFLLNRNLMYNSWFLTVVTSHYRALYIIYRRCAVCKNFF